MWSGPRTTSVSSGILIHPTVWRQYTNVIDTQSDKQDRRRSDSIGRTVLQTVEPFYKRSPKIKTSLEIRREAGMHCCNSIALRLIILLHNLDPWPTSVKTDAASTQAFVTASFSLVDRCTCSQSFWGFFGVVTVNVFSSANKNDDDIIGWVFLSNCFKWQIIARKFNSFTQLWVIAIFEHTCHKVVYERVWGVVE